MGKKIFFNNLTDPDYRTKEAFNSLRTNLKFCGNDIKTIVITSCTPNEGKSTVSVELCRCLAEDGKKVILIDGDLRKSVLVGSYRLETEDEIKGLSHYLSGQETLQNVIYNTDIDNFDLIVAGPVTPSPTELLGGDLFKGMIKNLKAEYDMVIIDSPPLGFVIDSAVIAPECDGAIIVIESDVISKRNVQEVKKQLEMAGCKILGAVLNKIENKKRQYRGYYKGYYKGYY
ncbi:MAG: CpsD/CapB family tyrosine-protein kinase [Eubacteriales bacterium]|nr:CpsD/CapB family tyrosine-protein kinase [Eubacteriales bacterium]